jgi:predicted small lipoprotein YifL
LDTFLPEYPVRPTLFALALMMIFAGCGYKAPLYLPEQKPAAAKPAPQPAPAAGPSAQP